MFSNDIVINIIEYIDNNLYRKITIDDLATYFSYNKDYLMRLFKREIGYTIINYINRLRVHNSLDTLRNSHRSILNIALSYGFSSQEYYSEVFSDIIGVSPNQYRKFYNNPISLSLKKIYITRENIVLLNDFINYIDYYKKNTYKPMVKSLSIFK